jgi:acyl-CoA thioesterase FadM
VTPVVVRAEVDYRKEVFPGLLTITTRLATLPEELSYRAEFQQKIEIRRNGAELLAVEARIYTAFIEMATRRLCTLQEFFENNRITTSPPRQSTSPCRS